MILVAETRFHMLKYLWQQALFQIDRLPEILNKQLHIALHTLLEHTAQTVGDHGVYTLVVRRAQRYHKCLKEAWQMRHA